MLYHCTAHEIGPIWLALASSSFFAANTNQDVPGAISFDAWGIVTPSTIRTQKAERVCQTQYPGLPESVTYFNSGRRPDGLANPEPYNAGYTSAAYQVTQFKRFGRFDFPERSLLQVYFPNRNGRTNTDLRLAALYEIRVDSVTVGAKEEICPPKIPGPTYLMDARFIQTAGKLGLLVKDWPSEDKVRRTEAFTNG